MRHVIASFVAVGLIAVSVSQAAAQVSASDYQNCFDKLVQTTKCDTQISSCSRIIADTGFPVEIRSNAFTQRGYAYYYCLPPDAGVARALVDYNEAIRADPKNPRAYFNRAILTLFNRVRLKQLDNADDVIADLTQVILIDPNFVEDAVGLGPESIYTTRANLLLNVRRDWDGAIADYDEAIRLHPRNVIGYASRGSAYLSRQNYDKAIADFLSWSRLDPEGKYADLAFGSWQGALIGAYIARAKHHEGNGRHADAIADFRRALAIRSTDTEALAGLKRLGAQP